MTTITICCCGHAHRIHSVLEGTECRACRCQAFTAAADDLHAVEATEAARARQEHRERLYNQLRTAVARHRLEDARQLLDQLASMREVEAR